MPHSRKTAPPSAGHVRPLLAALAVALTACTPDPTPGFDRAPSPVIAAPPPKPRPRLTRPIPQPTPKPGDLDADRVVAQAVSRVHTPLEAYRGEPPGSCDSANLMVAEMWAGGFADSFRRPSTVEQRRLYGGLALDVADVARERGCPDAAGRIYEAVLATYADGDYAGLRQRAQRGLAALAP
ncbi:MAG TPA: hypothetical protein PKA13_17295 [Geminicoccaceae bacterium]|nr:hypothetical protein [Geminicoccus sp.]HMU51533.1 hypothetical protein [Geminicoccaceae bacterium]